MMTLDEVIIGIKEQMGLGDPILLDALHYLEEYKNKQNVGTMMFALHNTNKTVCDDCWLSKEMAREDFKQIYKKYIEEENPSLTWDELKQMEGKPVWVEYLKPVWVELDGAIYDAEWCIVKDINDDVMLDTEGYGYGRANKYGDGFGVGWKAYRKERELGSKN